MFSLAAARKLSRVLLAANALSPSQCCPEARLLFGIRGIAEHSRKGPLRSDRFVDWLRVTAVGGQGGAGSTSFWHSKIRHRKGADGGNGGHGGNVILQASAAVRCLGNVMPHLKGRRGAAGGRQGSAGARGEDTVVLVPVGTRVWVAADELRAEPGPARGVSVDSPAPWGAEASAAGEAAEEEDEDAEDDDEDDSGYDSDDEGDDFEDDDDLREEPLVPPRGAAAARKSGLALLADLSAEGATVVAAAGGRGGRGNSQLDLDKPGSWRDRAEPGEPGQERRLLLELCSVADVGLVGPPNVGKSSLLGAMTNAKPEVGDYAFTTLRPQLGRLVAGGRGQGSPGELAATVADIPGLIPGAHENRGLGHAFLRHVERCATLAIVVDLSLGLKAGSPGPRPWDQFNSIVEEVYEYDPSLLARVALCVGTKLDCPGAKRAFGALKSRLAEREDGGVPAFAVSSVTGDGVADFQEALLRAAAEAAARKRAAEAAAAGVGEDRDDSSGSRSSPPRGRRRAHPPPPLAAAAAGGDAD